MLAGKKHFKFPLKLKHCMSVIWIQLLGYSVYPTYRIQIIPRKMYFMFVRLEPLVARIKEKRSAILCPMIDSIDDQTMSYPDYVGDMQVGGFSWSLFFNWMPMQKSQRNKGPTTPVKYIHTKHNILKEIVN